MRKPITLGRFALILLAIVVVMMLGIFSQLENWRRDLTINYASLDAESDDPRLRPPIVDQSISELVARMTNWVDQQDHWSVESSDTSDQSATLHLTRTTKVFRWVDDIHVTLSTVPGGVRVDAESQSRVGKADFGQNPRNLRELLTGTGLAGDDQ